MTATGDWIQVDWDADSCQASDYNLIFGALSELPGYTLMGSACSIGVTGTYDWHDPPAGDLFFLIVGVDDTGVYESSWGDARGGTVPSNMCGVRTRDNSLTCP